MSLIYFGPLCEQPGADPFPCLPCWSAGRRQGRKPPGGRARELVIVMQTMLARSEGRRSARNSLRFTKPRQIRQNCVNPVSPLARRVGLCSSMSRTHSMSLARNLGKSPRVPPLLPGGQVGPRSSEPTVPAGLVGSAGAVETPAGPVDQLNPVRVCCVIILSPSAR